MTRAIEICTSRGAGLRDLAYLTVIPRHSVALPPHRALFCTRLRD